MESLLLSRRALSSPTTCRFIPAHSVPGFPDDDLKLQFEAASRLDPEEKNVIRSVIESIVLRNTVKAAERRFSPGDAGKL